MKKICLISGLVILLMFLVSCEQGPPLPPGLPGEASPVGSAAGYLQGKENWATIARGTFNLEVAEPKDSIFNLKVGDNKKLTMRIDAQPGDYILRYAWNCKDNCDQNVQSTYSYFDLHGPDSAKYTQYWFKFEEPGMAEGQFDVSREHFRLGDNFIAAYACRKMGWGKWDCNNDNLTDDADNGPKYMLQTFKVYPVCEDSDGGQDYNKAGLISGVDNTGKVYNNEMDSCLSATSLKENYCVDGKPNFEYQIIMSAQYTCGLSNPAVCLYGACVNLPTETVDYRHGSLQEEDAKISVPTKVQLRTNGASLPVRVSHDVAYKQLHFGQNKDNGMLYNVVENSQAIYNYIWGNATAEILLGGGDSVSKQKAWLTENKLVFGTNYLISYACDKEPTESRLKCQEYSKRVYIMPTCFDTDLENSTIRGTTYGMTENGVVSETGTQDVCVSTTAGSSVVKEYYCGAGADNFIYIKDKQIPCANDEICFNGKCELYEVPETV